MLVRICLVIPPLAGMLFYFDMPWVMKVFGWGILLLVTFVALCYAICNLRNPGEFSCELTDQAFIQVSPHVLCGESFHISLSQITQIEVEAGKGESSTDHWFVHTESGRHAISINYGNPYQKFGEALQKALPHVTTIRT